MKSENFEMVAKTFQGLEDVLAGELTRLGAENVTPGRRMVSFTGDNEMLYKANLCCRTALRILKPICKFTASDPDTLYDMVKEMDWSSLLSVDKTFSIDPVVNSDTFTHSRYVTYRVKDAIVDYFQDRLGEGRRPGVRLQDADVMINVHIDGNRVTMSLDSSGESLHKRGWRKAQTEAPINEVLAAGMILMSGWRGETPFVDPMCGSGTFVIEAALIAAGIAPGIYRKSFAFETWPDFDPELLEEIYNDDSAEREVTVPIVAADIQRRAIEISMENAKSAGVDRYITFEKKPIEDWTQAPSPAGVLITNPPYGKRISADDMNGLYGTIGTKLKHVFQGYHAWIIGYQDEYFHEIGLAPSQKIALNNGGLDCELREYVIFEGTKRNFRAAGGRIKDEDRPARKAAPKGRKDGERRPFDRKPRTDDRKPFDRKPRTDDRRPADRKPFDRKPRTDAEAPEKKERRPLDLNRLGRTPSISADKEIVVNRPAWRARKKKDQ